MTIIHDSDCSLHNEPALPKGPCDCSAKVKVDAEFFRSALQAIANMHPGDQPASSHLSEEQWLRKHIVEMRVIASDALAASF